MDLENLIKTAENNVKPYFEVISDIVQNNTEKVLRAFRDNRVSTAHFNGTNGYGYDDEGREVIDKVFAQIFGAEDALVRYNFVNGTHAISTALWGILRPNDTLVYLDKPYDTLCQVIGVDREQSSPVGADNIRPQMAQSFPDDTLLSYGIRYIEADFNNLYRIVEEEQPKLVVLQKSKGYNWEKQSLTCRQIGEIAAKIKEKSPQTIVIVDNCYGEFVEKTEPIEEGADLIIGSLIKNIGGGIAQTGGYIAGRADLVGKCANRLTAVGLGKHVGCTLGANREILQGVFMAPHIVGEALKIAIFTAELFSLAGFEVSPKMTTGRPYNNPQSAQSRKYKLKKIENRKVFHRTYYLLPITYYLPHTDIVQAIKLGSAEKLIKFCQAIQNYSPIDSHLTPTPWDMPGYTNPVVMAAGTFVQGSSLELTADSAMREPYVAYLQGSLTYESGKIAVVEAFKGVLGK